MKMKMKISNLFSNSNHKIHKQIGSNGIIIHFLMFIFLTIIPYSKTLTLSTTTTTSDNSNIELCKRAMCHNENYNYFAGLIKKAKAGKISNNIHSLCKKTTTYSRRQHLKKKKNTYSSLTPVGKSCDDICKVCSGELTRIAEKLNFADIFIKSNTYHTNTNTKNTNTNTNTKNINTNTNTKNTNTNTNTKMFSVKKNTNYERALFGDSMANNNNGFGGAANNGGNGEVGSNNVGGGGGGAATNNGGSTATGGSSTGNNLQASFDNSVNTSETKVDPTGSIPTPTLSEIGANNTTTNKESDSSSGGLFGGNNYTFVILIIIGIIVIFLVIIAQETIMKKYHEKDEAIIVKEEQKNSSYNIDYDSFRCIYGKSPNEVTTANELYAKNYIK